MIDVGGTHVKLLATGVRQPRKLPSGPELTAARMVREVLEATADWKYDAVSLGYPGPVRAGRPRAEPKNVGGGWVRMDFERAFGLPVRVLNDAAMQALGAHRGGRMLFLGLGTGLGSALVLEGALAPLELAHLPYRKGRTFEDYAGRRGLERLGRRKWQRHVLEIVALLRSALLPDDVVLGGGNSRRLERLPPGTRLGSNAHAFRGGFLMWERC